MYKSIVSGLSRAACAGLAVCLFSIAASAATDVDVTVFGGIQRPGKLTVDTATNTGTSLVRTFEPKTFGVFGARISHGAMFGGEHSFAYAPNFIESDTKAFIYHSNFRIQAPLPVVKPYGTAGLGLVHTSGDATTSFGSNAGTKFAVNYGGGVKAVVGPIGVNMDVRGYTLPKISVSGFDVQQKLNFIQVTAGIVFSFKR